MIYGEKDHLSYFQINYIAFEYLEENLISAPILAIYDMRKDTELQCDASSQQGFTRASSYTKTD